MRVSAGGKTGLWKSSRNFVIAKRGKCMVGKCPIVTTASDWLHTLCEFWTNLETFLVEKTSGSWQQIFADTTSAWGNSRRDCFSRVQAQAGEAGRSRGEKLGTSSVWITWPECRLHTNRTTKRITLTTLQINMKPHCTTLHYTKLLFHILPAARTMILHYTTLHWNVVTHFTA